jgi:hypothetical protein
MTVREVREVLVVGADTVRLHFFLLRGVFCGVALEATRPDAGRVFSQLPRAVDDENALAVCDLDDVSPLCRVERYPIEKPLRMGWSSAAEVHDVAVSISQALAPCKSAAAETLQTHVQ